jgi:hypothetical protein
MSNTARLTSILVQHGYLHAADALATLRFIPHDMVMDVMRQWHRHDAGNHEVYWDAITQREMRVPAKHRLPSIPFWKQT